MAYYQWPCWGWTQWRPRCPLTVAIAVGRGLSRPIAGESFPWFEQGRYKEAIRGIDKLKLQLESTRGHTQDPHSRDYVNVKTSEALKRPGEISAQLGKTLTSIS